jgi:hypothetical protein
MKIIPFICSREAVSCLGSWILPVGAMFFKKLALLFQSMREPDPCLGQRAAKMILASILLLASSAHAFPLYGSNGVVNATVYGIMEYEYGDGMYIDISASDSDVYDVELVDSDNMTYGGNSAPYRSTLHGFPTETAYNSAIRDMLLFKVPKNIIINGLRIIPHDSGTFFINWTGEPKATADGITIGFYRATFEPNGMGWHQVNWNFEVNLTNDGNPTEDYNISDFAMLDQFGWVYQSKRDSEIKNIPPGESLRFNVVVPLVSEIARPVAILFKGIKMNISAWA